MATLRELRISDRPESRLDSYPVATELALESVRTTRRACVRHTTCELGTEGLKTVVGRKIVQTLAVSPELVTVMYCVHCHKHRPSYEFEWVTGGAPVATRTR